MPKIAIVGCGKISDAHVLQIRRIPGCEIVATCDREPLMAAQLQERFEIKSSFSDLGRMLEVAKPDVVHIATSPESHYFLAKQCLERGVHVLVEKPFTLNMAEAEELIDLANAKGARLTVSHDEQFSPAMREMRRLVGGGFLGGAAIHVESTWCYRLGESSYAKALLADRNYWVRRLPGKLLHNVISHGVAKIAEFLPGTDLTVQVHGFPSRFLQECGADDIIDELRVIIADKAGPTAYFTFSTQMRPTLHQLRVYGSRNSLILDEDQQTLLKVRGERHKSYLEIFAPPLTYSRQYLANWSRNCRLFARNKLHTAEGKRHLFEEFYRSVDERSRPVPIPYSQILTTARIMDAIFSQLPIAGPNTPAVRG